MTNSLMFLGNIGTGEIVIIAFVVLLLFGGKKIPELMRGVGKGVKSFKDGMNDIEKQINTEPDQENSKKEETSNKS
ncbi:MAG TPA: twin-arginine translocase TatA/TatE family subunit [Prevotellaceae bacterium]|nr:twin-arginine translocase TatA/TatE family subunit [Prevotellaceae bacterium]